MRAHAGQRLALLLSGGLLAIIVVAAGLRLHGITFGLPAVNDPDELMFELGAIRMLSGKSLNPGWFGHPATTTMYLLALLEIATFGIGRLTGRFADADAFLKAVYADPGVVMIPHRLAMVGFAIGTVALTGRLTRRLWELGDGRAGGQTAGAIAALTAAILLASNPVHVLWSQVVRSDVMACLFLQLCLLAACDFAEGGNSRDRVRCGWWAAMATATKWPFALGLLGMAGAALVRIRAGASPRQTLRDLALAAGLAAIDLLVISPYLVLAWPTVLANIAGEAQQQHLGATGGTPWHNLAWYMAGPVWAGLGPVGLGLAVIGLCHARRHVHVLAIVLPVALGFCVTLSFQRIVWDRWALPVMQILAMLAGLGMAHIFRHLQRGWRPAVAVSVVALILFSAATPLMWQSWQRGTERLHDTRQQASRWVFAHVPPGQTILVEHFGFDLLAGDWTLLFPFGSRGCQDARRLLAGRIGHGAIESGRAGRSNVDYGTLDPRTRWSCRADWAVLTQADRYLAESGRFPAEAAAYRALIAGGRRAALFRPRRGETGGPVVQIIDLRGPRNAVLPPSPRG